MEIEIGREYNIQSYHRFKDDNNYIFRGIVTKHLYDDTYSIKITEFNVSKGQRVGDTIKVYRDRFKSLVTRTNREAKRFLQEEF